MSPADYAALIEQHTKDFHAGKARGLRDGADPEPGEQDFAYKSVAYEDGYWTGWRMARNPS